MRRVPVLHPVLVAVFPALFVCAQNIHQFTAGALVMPALALVASCAALWALLWLLTRSLRKSALLASLFFLLFFSFAAASSVLPQFTWVLPGGATIGPRKLTFAVWLGLFAAGCWCVLRTRRDLAALTRVLNVAALALVLVPAFRIGWYEARHRLSAPAATDAAEDDPDVIAAAAGPRPDIYWIIMDAYAREDVLRDLYGLDTSDFTGWLREKGFYVADCSTCNYPFTSLAVPSPLQMDYVEAFIPADVRESSTDVHLMTEIANDSALVRFLRRRGYTIIAFPSGDTITEMSSAEVFLVPGRFYGEFSTALIEMTPLRAFFRGADRFENRRRHLLFMFRTLEAIASRPGPKFVVAHFMAPHRPFVFGRNGARVSPPNVNTFGNTLPKRKGLEEEYRRYYADQVVFLNTKLRATIGAILAKSARPPVIVLQGDHGPISLLTEMLHPDNDALRERFRILNAYYLAGESDNALYPGITPVNSFRVVLNHVFGTRYELLSDRNYFPPAKPYQYYDVTPIVGEGRTVPPAPENSP